MKPVRSAVIIAGVCYAAWIVYMRGPGLYGPEVFWVRDHVPWPLRPLLLLGRIPGHEGDSGAAGWLPGLPADVQEGGENW